MRNFIQLDFLSNMFLSPKELAAKANVTPVTVYAWLRKGLPFRRRGARGSILIDYDAYLSWMLECAKVANVGDKPQCGDKVLPEWAVRASRGANG